jgi:hypothetical protein
MLQPTRSAFWRLILLVTFLFVLLTTWNLIDLAGQLNVRILSRPSWLSALITLGFVAATILLGYLTSFSKSREQLWTFFESPTEFVPRTFGVILFLIGLVGFSSITYLRSFKELLGGEDWVRLLIFWSFSLLGMWGIKIFRKETAWLSALIIIVLLQTTLHLLLSYWSQVTSYPFATGWSETSRYYFPSLFVSQEVYGQQFPFPILHPTLHLLLTPPYLFHAPLWFHRFWQVALRYILIAAVVPAILKRISIQDKKVWWLVAVWIFLFLFMGPIYFHLTIPVILILIGFSLHDDRRNWFVILTASAYCGWSRVNWYPVPALMAAVLYILETPFKGKSLWQYVWKPALWGIVGTLTAFAFQRLYIVISGVTDSQYFYTSISSSLLWYRLLPNATYPPGLLLAVLFASLPMWLAIYLVLRSHKTAFHPLRIVLLLSALLVLFIGGLIVSLKIGGGADIHNMDAYFVVLLIIFMYLVFAKYRREDGEFDQPMQLHWLNGMALLVPVVWFLIQPNIGFVTYDAQRTQSVLEALQQRVDQVNSQGGEILFITQRQLISMNMLHGVKLIPEYEREDLMEMAMSDNEEYLDKFKTDLQNQRFALIIVDPLKYKLVGKSYPFGEENNVWVSRAMKPILCNYRQDAIFPEDEIALYVPQMGTRQCP